MWANLGENVVKGWGLGICFISNCDEKSVQIKSDLFLNHIDSVEWEAANVSHDSHIGGVLGVGTSCRKADWRFLTPMSLAPNWIPLICYESASEEALEDFEPFDPTDSYIQTNAEYIYIYR